MKKMPSRDTSGHCEGDCRNIVRDGEESRQKKINRYEYSHKSSVSPSWARNRTEQPGFYGGHV
jgi:hypothetical protein